MDKLISFCRKAFSYPRLLYITHPVTALSVIVTALLFSIHSYITLATDFNGPAVFFCICMSCLFFTAFALFFESIRPEWSTRVKSAVYVFFGLLSLVMGFLLLDTSERSRSWLVNLISDTQMRLGEATIAMYIIGLVVIALILAIYFSYSHDIHQAFNSHTVNSTSKIFFSSIIYGVIQLGVLLLTIIITVLLYDDAFEYFITILILINGLFYIPAVIYSLTHENEPANMFFQVIVRYITLTLTLMAFAIIYIYIIKLVVTVSVPSNSVYSILTALFIVSMFITYMCTSFEEKGFLQKFAYLCPYIFAPFILMQCYTVIVRIGQYGLTPKRYFGVAFILFEITYIVYYAIERKRGQIAGRNILLIICLFIIIPVFLPGIGARPLSTILAKNTLASYLEVSQSGGTVTDRQYMRANAAYEFLTDSDFGGMRFSKYFSGIDSDTLKALKDNAKEAAGNFRDADGSVLPVNERYAWYSTDINALASGDGYDISGYDRLIHVWIKSADKQCDTAKLSVYVYDNEDYDARTPVDKCPTVDLTKYCEDFKKIYDEQDLGISPSSDYNDEFNDISTVDINENVRLCITNTDITYDKNDEISAVNLEGYLFMGDQ